eukprot:Tbor_TRINITY_DN5413_c1_g1::TRINITY_DN5413_c1_g1_i1::g.24573::m.24573
MELSHPKSTEYIRHPIEALQNNNNNIHQYNSHIIRSTQGWAPAANNIINNNILLRSKRYGGLPSSNILYNSYNGYLTDIDVGDLYNNNNNNYNNPNVSGWARGEFEKEFLGEELTIKTINI